MAQTEITVNVVALEAIETETLRKNYPFGSQAETEYLRKISPQGFGCVPRIRFGGLSGASTQRDIIRRYGDLVGTQLIAETDYTFDLNGRLTDLDTSNSFGAISEAGASAIAFYDYSYDINNRITEFATSEGVSIYNYDDTDQLTEADHDYQVDEKYTYDDNGNRTNPGYSTGILRLDDGKVYQ